MGSSLGVCWIEDYAFNNVLQIEWLSREEHFSGAGDSGSLVFAKASSDGKIYGLGIIFAMGTSIVIDAEGDQRMEASFACDLNDALDNLEADWLE